MKKNWASFILISTFCNGITFTTMKALNQYKLSEFIITYFVTVYAMSTLWSVINLKVKFSNFQKNEIFVGIGLGASLIAGMVCVVLALKSVPACFVYPLVNGGAVVIISIVAFFLFKEKYSIFGILGVIMGIISIIFLSL